MDRRPTSGFGSADWETYGINLGEKLSMVAAIRQGFTFQGNGVIKF
jgi:hypothetical protein